MATDHDSIREDALEWFLTGFSGRDLAEPLLSVEEGTNRTATAAVFSTSTVDVVGVRKVGKVIGWCGAAQLSSSPDQLACQPFDYATLISDAAPLNEVVSLLHVHPRLFVRAFGHVCGVITRAAVEKPPARMWLFGLVTICEQRVTRLIDDLLPNDAWQEQLSAGRLAKAREIQAMRHQRGQQRTLLDCLQFADKGQIVARNESLRARTRFSSRSEVERFVQALQDLRNNLAHAQDISGDWDVIYELAANVHQIVGGRSDVPP
jgi:hypothetical protein